MGYAISRVQIFLPRSARKFPGSNPCRGRNEMSYGNPIVAAAWLNHLRSHPLFVLGRGSRDHVFREFRRRSSVDHCVGVLYTHSVCPIMVLHDVHDRVIRVL